MIFLMLYFPRLGALVGPHRPWALGIFPLTPFRSYSTGMSSNYEAPCSVVDNIIEKASKLFNCSGNHSDLFQFKINSEAMDRSDI
jgi:hypothetical protein